MFSVQLSVWNWFSKCLILSIAVDHCFLFVLYTNVLLVCKYITCSVRYSIIIVAIVYVCVLCCIVLCTPYADIYPGMNWNKMKWKCHEANERMWKSKRKKIICSFVRCLSAFTWTNQNINKETIWLLLRIWTNRLRRISISPRKPNTFSLFMYIRTYV